MKLNTAEEKLRNKQSILERPHLEDIMFRYYKGEILIVSREAHRKNTHIEWEKIA